MRLVRIVPVLLLAATAAALAQSADPAAATFDAVSIRRDTADRPPIGVISRANLPDGSLHLTWVPMLILIGMAYPAPTPDYIVGLPEWARRDHYDVVATSPFKTVTPEQRLGMLRAMLADRLKLSVHMEKRPHDVFRLVLARKDGRLGAGLTKSDTDCNSVVAARRGTAVPRPPVSPDTPPATCTARMRFDRKGQALAEGEAPLDTLAGLLRGPARRFVVNETGLVGYYRFRLTFDPRSSLASPGTEPPDRGASVFTALEEQLGLKLLSAKEDQDTVVIDHIEPPSEN